jgi:hypothetical protein
MQVLLLFLFLLPLELLKPPASIPAEKGTVVVFETNGKPRWSANWTMQPATVNGQKAVKFTEEGKGNYDSYPPNITWTTESVWLAGSAFQPLSVDKVVRDSNGATLTTEQKAFDLTKNVIRLTRTVANGRQETKTLQAPSDTLAADGLAGILRSLPFGENRNFPAHLLSNEPKIYDVTFEPRGRERVRTAVGEFDCYKIEVVPHLGVLNVAKIFIGGTYFWFSAGEPHFWVKYEGYENGIGSPRIRMELGK